MMCFCDSERQVIGGCFTGVNNTNCSNIMLTSHHYLHCTNKKHITNKKMLLKKTPTDSFSCLRFIMMYCFLFLSLPRIGFEWLYQPFELKGNRV